MSISEQNIILTAAMKELAQGRASTFRGYESTSATIIIIDVVETLRCLIACSADELFLFILALFSKILIVLDVFTPITIVLS